MPPLFAPGEALPLGISHACTDEGNARRLVSRHGRDIRYVPPWKRWYIWTGERWEPDERNLIWQRVSDTIQYIGQEAVQAESEPLAKWAHISQMRTHYESVERLGRNQPELIAQPSEFDADPLLLPVRNGCIDLRTGAKRVTRREDMVSRVAGTEHHPDAQCPRWEQMIRDLFFDDTNLCTFAQRMVGYTLTGRIDEQVMFFLWGDGSNGKSTFVNVLTALLGDYAAQAPDRMLEKKWGESHPTELTLAHGKRLFSANETRSGSSLDEQRVKMLVSTERISARKMHQDFWSFQPTHKLWVCGNHKPVIESVDGGIWRRVLLIPFTRTFYGPDSQPELRKRPGAMPGEPGLERRLIEQELPGILNWAIAGWLDVQQRGLQVPDAVKGASENYRKEQDAVASFVAECCKVSQGHGPDDSESASKLYEAFLDWTGRKDISQTTFGARLREMGFRRFRSSNVTKYRGIKLTGDNETQAHDTGTLSPQEENDTDDNESFSDWKGM